MAEPAPFLIRILAQVDGSEVVNEIGTIEVDAVTGPLPDGIDAPDAAKGTISLDLAGALRRLADEIDADGSDDGDLPLGERYDGDASSEPMPDSATVDIGEEPRSPSVLDASYWAPDPMPQFDSTGHDWTGDPQGDTREADRG